MWKYLKRRLRNVNPADSIFFFSVTLPGPRICGGYLGTDTKTQAPWMFSEADKLVLLLFLFCVCIGYWQDRNPQYESAGCCSWILDNDFILYGFYNVWSTKFLEGGPVWMCQKPALYRLASRGCQNGCKKKKKNDPERSTKSNQFCPIWCKWG